MESFGKFIEIEGTKNLERSMKRNKYALEANQVEAPGC